MPVKGIAVWSMAELQASGEEEKLEPAARAEAPAEVSDPAGSAALPALSCDDSFTFRPSVARQTLSVLRR